MAKLYWRVKKNGKWTWQPANVHEQQLRKVVGLPAIDVTILLEEEE